MMQMTPQTRLPPLMTHGACDVAGPERRRSHNRDVFGGDADGRLARVVPPVVGHRMMSGLSILSPSSPTKKLADRVWRDTKQITDGALRHAPFQGSSNVALLPCQLDMRAAMQILDKRDRLQMVRIHTGPVSTQVIKGQAIRNWSLDQFIHVSMGRFSLGSRALNPAISKSAHGCGPYPTRRSKPAIFDRIKGVNIRSPQKALVANQETPMVSAIDSAVEPRSRANLRSFTATAHAQARGIGVCWGILEGHSMSFHRVSRTRLFKQRGCISLSQVYQNL